LDSWACALTYIPKEHPIELNASLSSGQLQSCSDVELAKLLDQERIIDEEIREELDQFRMRDQIGMDFDGVREGESAEEDENPPAPVLANEELTATLRQRKNESARSSAS